MTHPTDLHGEAAVEAVGLGLRHRRGWALRDCSFRLPRGRVCGLIGPNGAGKSTLLSLTAGLMPPSEGALTVLGSDPREAAGRRPAYVAQEKPLYRRFTVAETLDMGRLLNPGSWDQGLAERVVAEGGIPSSARISALSGGQRTRVALALGLGRRAELLLLDEPTAEMDPVARHRMAGTLMELAAEYGTTIVMSSHVVTDVEDTCDFLLMVVGGQVRLAGGIDELVGAHRVLTGVHVDGAPDGLAGHTVVEDRVTGRQRTALVRSEGPVGGPWKSTEASLEEVVLAHLRASDAPLLITADAEVRSAAREPEVAA